MNKNRILAMPVPEIENAYILISFSARDKSETYGETKVRSLVSFLYQNGDIAAEWEAEHGPIQIWKRCNADHPKAQEHYFYDYVIDEWGNWSQLAVDKNQLPAAANHGDWKYIFGVLRNWANR